MHLMMMAESGISMMAGPFLEPNAGVLAIMTAGRLLHQATVVYEVEHTVSRQEIPAREQHTHTSMETLPLDILSSDEPDARCDPIMITLRKDEKLPSCQLLRLRHPR